MIRALPIPLALVALAVSPASAHGFRAGPSDILLGQVLAEVVIDDGLWSVKSSHATKRLGLRITWRDPNERRQSTAQL